MKATIVGGGIGGLASAVALGRQGWQVEVLERTPAIEPVGAGLSLWCNGLRALHELGVGDQVRQHAEFGVPAGIRDERGRWLNRPDPGAFADRYGEVAMIHRAALHDILLTAAPGAIRTGVTVQQVHADGTVAHSEGTNKADLVVGADGLHSTVRATLWPTAPSPRYVGYTAWRMITTHPVAIDHGGETWGRGDRFGYEPLPDGRVYCYAVANAREGAGGGTLEDVRRRFTGWHDPVPRLLRAVDPVELLHHDLYELPPLTTYQQGSVVLVGDAAHAMTPDLGQGACQALEDAVVLGRLAGSERLSHYDAARRPRSQDIARRSRSAGSLAQAAHPVPVWLRNTLMRLAPASAALRSLAPALDWSPPT